MKLTAEQLSEHRAAIAAHYADDPRVADFAKCLGHLVPVVRNLIHTQVITAEQGQPGLVKRIMDYIEAHGDPKIEAHLEAVAPQLVNMIDGLSKPIT